MHRFVVPTRCGIVGRAVALNRKIIVHYIVLFDLGLSSVRW